MLKKFPTTGPQVVQGPGENAGVLRLPDGWAVAFKIESHNHPSAVEPYQGAATGVGGILRDVFTMGARPVAVLNSLRLGPLDTARNRYLFGGIVKGVGDYGNCVGVPTLGGEVDFAPGYSGNPLVNAMCVGLLRESDLMRAAAHGVGNVLLTVGARTGRDGIHGASFASEELSEKSEARRPQVQVGDPFTEKLLLEATLELIERRVIVAIQDMGAAGLTSSSAEMAARGGVGVELETDLVPIREASMTPYEIMLCESQERMLVVAEPHRVERHRGDLPPMGAGVGGRRAGDGRRHVPGASTTASSSRRSPGSRWWTTRRSIIPEAQGVGRRGAAPGSLAARRWPWIWPLRWSGCWASPRSPRSAGSMSSTTPPSRASTLIGPGGDAGVLRVADTDFGLAVTVDCNSGCVTSIPTKAARRPWPKRRATSPAPARYRSASPIA